MPSIIPSTKIQSPILNRFSTNTKIPEIKFLNKSCAPKATATPNKPKPAIIGPIFIPHNSKTAARPSINISETSNWLISWIITLQYDTTVDQLKTIRNQIENHIKKSEDFNTSIGIAVRVDKFSDSSIDMYVRCFTKSDSWNEWLSVKEKLAIEIKKIVENNNASFAFPSQSIYIEKK